MPRRHAEARRKPTIHHTIKERQHRRRIKRKQGPSAQRRRERRLPLQPKPQTDEQFAAEQAATDAVIAPDAYDDVRIVPVGSGLVSLAADGDRQHSCPSTKGRYA